MQLSSDHKSLAVGLDPGGTGAFGWALVPLSRDYIQLEASGCVGGAHEAIAAAQEKLTRAPDAVGIDAPLYWVGRDDRQADQIVRQMLLQAGGRSSTVLHVNSLMGACLVQGALAAHLARAAWSGAAITEAHPKALLRISKSAAEFDSSITQKIQSDHERDAALAAFAALHGARDHPAWRNLRALERGVWFPIEPVSYWFPNEVTRLPDTIPSVELAQMTERVLNLYRDGQLTFELPQEYQYASITLAIIDAVYSIGVKYSGVRATVNRYCEAFRLKRVRALRDHLPDPAAQESVSQLCKHFRELGVDRMAAEVFKNRQRTSPKNGILKAEAVWLFAQALRQNGIEYLQDLPPIPIGGLDDAIRAIPGHDSGISLRYFRMLVGAEDFIKPDRMILRFIEKTTGARTSIGRASSLLLLVANCLRNDVPAITPRLLDHALWEYQRNREAKTNAPGTLERQR